VKLPIRYQAAIVDQDRVLLLLALDFPSGKTFWLFPGGGILEGETPEACVQREVFEETSLQVEVQRLILDVEDIPESAYYRLHTYLCAVREGKAMPGIEPEVDLPGQNTIQEVGWFDLRFPATCPALMVQDPITYPQMQRLREALGYGCERDE
jgi:8-oxo-dGTP pyrophosphatase MutT (NUDIX family)